MFKSVKGPDLERSYALGQAKRFDRSERKNDNRKKIHGSDFGKCDYAFYLKRVVGFESVFGYKSQDVLTRGLDDEKVIIEAIDLGMEDGVLIFDQDQLIVENQLFQGHPDALWVGSNGSRIYVSIKTRTWFWRRDELGEYAPRPKQDAPGIEAILQEMAYTKNGLNIPFTIFQRDKGSAGYRQYPGPGMAYDHNDPQLVSLYQREMDGFERILDGYVPDIRPKRGKKECSYCSLPCQNNNNPELGFF